MKRESTPEHEEQGLDTGVSTGVQRGVFGSRCKSATSLIYRYILVHRLGGNRLKGRVSFLGTGESWLLEWVTLPPPPRAAAVTRSEKE